MSLYGYGPRENDREYVERRVDFNSPLFKPETGFPFGKTLRDSLYVSLHCPDLLRGGRPSPKNLGLGAGLGFVQAGVGWGACGVCLWQEVTSWPLHLLPCAQFTDNGQIIFPPSDSSTLTSPNPPPGGFNGREEVPMIAVFWDNADFSRGTGTTFYQVGEAIPVRDLVKHFSVIRL